MVIRPLVRGERDMLFLLKEEDFDKDVIASLLAVKDELDVACHGHHPVSRGIKVEAVKIGSRTLAIARESEDKSQGIYLCVVGKAEMRTRLAVTDHLVSPRDNIVNERIDVLVARCQSGYDATTKYPAYILSLKELEELVPLKCVGEVEVQLWLAEHVAPDLIEVKSHLSRTFDMLAYPTLPGDETIDDSIALIE